MKENKEHSFFFFFLNELLLAMLWKMWEFIILGTESFRAWVKANKWSF